MSTRRVFAVLAGAAICAAGCDATFTSAIHNPELEGVGKLVGVDGPHPGSDHTVGPPSGGQTPLPGPGGPGPRILVCHLLPGDPGAGVTMLLPPRVAAMHLAHGDTPGPCPDVGCAQKDSDDDGVNDCDDECADTPTGQTVDETGCPVLVLRVDAGPDWSVSSGDVVVVEATVEVVQGRVAADQLVWSWQQTDGPTADFEASGPGFSFDTAERSGSFSFQVTVSDPSGETSASDAFQVDVQSSIVHLAAGKWHNAALYSGSRIRTWGLNANGQLGDGTLEHQVVDVDANLEHTVVARDDGTAWTFGADALNDSATPAQVPGASDVVRVAAMARGAFMLQSTGELLGFTAAGGECVLGGTPSVDKAGNILAVDVAVAPPDLIDIATGAAHVVALDAAGTAWVWGSRFGCAPVPVLDDVVTIAAGDTDLCLFVRADGSAWGLGFNLHGQLGNGTTVSDFSTPRPVTGLTDVVHVAAGDRHSLFVTADGSLFATGWNRYCQLGLEAEPEPEAPEFGFTVLTPVQVLLDDVVHVAGGNLHTIATTADGRVWGWGLNNVGQLDGGTFSLLPETVCSPMLIDLE